MRAAAEIASDWVEGHSSRARLVGGGDGMAGVELQLPEGWKTYWRTPGEAGGVPPSFDWSKSTNLDSAQVLYPAPKRFTDKAGDTIGYKGNVMFPVRLKPKDPSKPIDVQLALDYGVCKDICIPAEAELTLTVPPDAAAMRPTSSSTRWPRVPAPPRGAARERSGAEATSSSSLSAPSRASCSRRSFRPGRSTPTRSSRRRTGSTCRCRRRSPTTARAR